MRLATGHKWLVVVALATACGAWTGGPAMAAPPEAPKVSTFAPAEDLVKQVGDYLKALEENVSSEENFKDAQTNVAKDSNTLVLLALALGMHDSDNQYKAAAGAMFKAAKEVAAAKDYAAAKKAVAALKAAAESKGGAAELKWEKAASLEELMKQVPLVNNKLKGKVKPERFARGVKDAAGYSAVLAVIAQGSIADTEKAKSEKEVKQWYDFCIQMRDAAAAVNKSVHAGDKEGTQAAMKKLAQSCDDCHGVFHKAAKTEEK
jgi:hypothetical protein